MNTRIIQRSFKSIFKHFPKNCFSTAEAAQPNTQATPTTKPAEVFDLNESSKSIARSVLLGAADKTVSKVQDIKLPYNFKGSRHYNTVKKEYDDLAISSEQLPQVEEKLKEVFQKFMKGLASKTVDDLPDIESNFLLSVLASIETLKKNRISLELVKNETDFKQKNLTESLKIFERMYLNGVVVERAYNAPKEEYTIIDKYQELGLLFFGVNDTFIDNPERKFKFSWEVEKNPVSKKAMKQMVLRTYVQYTSPYVLRVKGQGEEQDYTYTHSAVIENQLLSAPAGSMASLTIGEWLRRFRLSNRWILTDFDGAFGGNPLLTPQAQHSRLVHTKTKFKDLQSLLIVRER